MERGYTQIYFQLPHSMQFWCSYMFRLQPAAIFRELQYFWVPAACLPTCQP